MSKKIIVPFIAALVLGAVHLAQAQQAKVYRIGVIFEGGPFYKVIDGLRDGLKESGVVEGKHYVLAIRDLKGDTKEGSRLVRKCGLSRSKREGLMPSSPAGRALRFERAPGTG